MNKPTAADLLDGELFDLPIEKKIRIWELIDQHVKSEHFEEFTIVSTLIIKGYFENKEKMGKYMEFYIQRYPYGYFTGLFKYMLADKPSDVCEDSLTDAFGNIINWDKTLDKKNDKLSKSHHGFAARRNT